MPWRLRMLAMVLAGQVVAEIGECTDNAVVTPATVLLGHADDQSLDIGAGSRSPGPTFRAAVVLGRDELAVPGKQRFGSDDGCYLGQSTATKRLGANRESTTLIVGETKTMTAELLSEDAILFRQVVNDVLHCAH